MTVVARRKWLRCNAHFPVRVKVLDEKNKRVWTSTGSTINIGGGGAMLEVPGLSGELIENLIKEKYKLQLALEFPNIFRGIEIRAEVIWVEESRKIPGKFGVTFEDLPEEKEAKIINFVEEHLSKEITNHAFKRALEKWFRVHRERLVR
jgi:c-di-GMP-binding flagellar brake protein YcgR